MVDPVTAEDGCSYERCTIERWFQQGHKRSPKTKAELCSGNLKPNEALREAIEEFMEEMPREMWDRIEMRAWRTILTEACEVMTCRSSPATASTGKGLSCSHGSSRRTSQCAFSSDSCNTSFPCLPLRSGWLQKRSRYLRQWRRRWICLSNTSLRSFESTAEDAKPTESLELHSILRAYVVQNQDRSRAVIVRICLDHRRDVLLCADSSDEAGEWSAAIDLAASEARRRLKRQLCTQMLMRGMLVA